MGKARRLDGIHTAAQDNRRGHRALLAAVLNGAGNFTGVILTYFSAAGGSGTSIYRDEAWRQRATDSRYNDYPSDTSDDEYSPPPKKRKTIASKRGKTRR